jgi:transposase
MRCPVARYNQPRRTWRYTEEFKAKAVQLSLLEGVRVQEVARTLDIHPFMLSRWRKEYKEGKIVTDGRRKVVSIRAEKTEIDRVKRLEKENARLRQENELLKKWQRFLAEEHQIVIDSSRGTGNSV